MGIKIFTTQFRHADGFGDGPIELGGRPTLQDNGTFLRVNGLDSQTCVACHDVVSADAAPAILGVGGSAGIGSSAMFMTRAIDAADATGNGFAAFDGRLINPPALFGVGGVQLVAKEMTAKLQELKRQAINNPGVQVQLNVKGVDFGHVVADQAGNLDTAGVEGVDLDLVVRPFGRKGEFATVRQFDVGALMFHFGMQPVESVGRDVDADGDGVANEITIGELSALEIFLTTQERPVQLSMDKFARSGFRQFKRVGCAGCHKPAMNTKTQYLSYSYPEVETDPGLNVYFEVDLTAPPSGFQKGRRGGLVVPMFSDLKRHDMGPELAEDFHAATAQQNSEFITAKLWGVADSAPYLHDGRALTLNEAIYLHGGEAQTVRDAYVALSIPEKNELIAFLLTLRNPRNPNADVLE
jgi:cytochrome c peroxidase